MRVAVVACLLCAMAPGQVPKPSAPAPDPECFRPLEEFCAPDTCPTYAAQVDSLRAGGNCYGAATVGRCGTFRTTHRGDGFVSETKSFTDRAGKLVAVPEPGRYPHEPPGSTRQRTAGA